MTTENDLILAIKNSLETGGAMGKFKAEMRTAVMNIINSKEPVGKPKPTQEILIINELIREYLSWMGYKYAKTVFVQESGLSSEPMSRSQILETLGVVDTEDSMKFSLLHGLVSAFKEGIQENASVKSESE